MNYNIAKLISHRASYTCQMCGKSKFDKMYEYQDYSYVPRYIPPHLKRICGNCIYREVYGTNLAKKKKKEGTLDEM